MARTTPWKDEYTLLCEKCAYVLEGLDAAGPCPECGKPIEESLPERRVGTPWQQKPGVKSLVQTWWLTLRHPKRTLDVMHFNNDLGDNHAACSLLAAFIGLVILMLISIIPDSPKGFGFVFIVAVIASFPGWVVCFLLATIESLAFLAFARMKNYRVNLQMAWVFTGHATAYIVLVLFLVLLGIIILTRQQLIIYPSPENAARIEHTSFMWNITTKCMIASFIAGFLLLQYFAYLGLRRCKYANRIRPQEQTDG